MRARPRAPLCILPNKWRNRAGKYAKAGRKGRQKRGKNTADFRTFSVIFLSIKPTSYPEKKRRKCSSGHAAKGENVAVIKRENPAKGARISRLVFLFRRCHRGPRMQEKNALIFRSFPPQIRSFRRCKTGILTVTKCCAFM